MKIFIVCCAFFVIISCQTEIFPFPDISGEQYLQAGPIYVGNEEIVVNTVMKNSINTYYLYRINISDGKIVMNYSQPDGFDDIIWINGTELIVTLNFESNGGNAQFLKVWNLSNSSSGPLYQYTVSNDGYGDFALQLVESNRHYVAFAKSFQNCYLKTINIYTGDTVWNQDLQNCAEGFALNANRYSYYYEQWVNQTQQSLLAIGNPKTKQEQIALTIDYGDAFYSLSAFKAENFGNLLLIAMNNGTVFIMDTLSGNITATATTHYASQCSTIWDEKKQLFYCYQKSSNNIRLFEESKMIYQFNFTVPYSYIQSAVFIPQYQEFAVVLFQTIYILNYTSTNQMDQEKEFKFLSN